MHHFTIRQNKHRMYVVRFHYKNEAVFTSVPLSTHEGALNVVESIKSFGPEARVVDKT